MLIIYDDAGTIRTVGVAIEPHPAVTHQEPVMGMVDVPGEPDADGNPTTIQQEQITGVQTVIDTPAETEAECIARMIAVVVPAGAQHLTAPPAIVPDAPVERWAVDFGTGLIPVRPPRATVDQVVAERERRMALGFFYDFGDERGTHHIGTSAADMKGWDEVTQATQALIAIGLDSMQMNVVTNTGLVTITAIEWQHILVAAAASRQPLWTKSFQLQVMNPIPADYASDQHWA